MSIAYSTPEPVTVDDRHGVLMAWSALDMALTDQLADDAARTRAMERARDRLAEALWGWRAGVQNPYAGATPKRVEPVRIEDRGFLARPVLAPGDDAGQGGFS
jgi:hypothetical protein